MMLDEIILSNIEFEKDYYEINPHINLKKIDKGILLSINNKKGFEYESNPYLFFRALQLALPKVTLRISKHKNASNQLFYDTLKGYISPLFNFYPSKDTDIISDQSHLRIDEVDLERIKKVHLIICQYNKSTKELKEKGVWKPRRWDFSYQQYLSSCSALSIENSTLHIISGLESLLIKGEGLLTYRVSLYASLIIGNTPSERKEIFNSVKNMYNLRSKVAHGEVESLIKILSKTDIYQKYYSLKEILSKLLIITYNIEHEELQTKIDDLIFNSPKFEAP